jgi:hypothetical protein
MSAGRSGSGGSATMAMVIATVIGRAGCRRLRGSCGSRSHRSGRLLSRSCRGCFARATRSGCCAPTRSGRWSSARSCAACRCAMSSRCVRRPGSGGPRSRPWPGSARSCTSASKRSVAVISTSSSWSCCSSTRSTCRSAPAARRRGSSALGDSPKTAPARWFRCVWERARPRRTGSSSGATWPPADSPRQG